MHTRPRIRVTTAPPTQTRQHRARILYGLAGLFVVVLLAFVWWRSAQPDVQRPTGPRERPVPEYVVTEKQTPMRQDLRLPKDYSKLPLEVPAPAPPVAPPAPGQPAPPKATAAPPRSGRWTPPPPAPPQGLPPPPPAPQSGSTVMVQSSRAAAPNARVQPVSQTTPPPARWFGPKAVLQGNVLSAPVPTEPGETEPSKVFPKAVWQRPKDPTKVLYADQVIHGLLMQDLNSETPGTVRIKVTQAVVDRWGLGEVLLPLDTTMLGTMAGQARYGQKRVPVAVTMGILPDGTAIQFGSGQAGDAMGAAGVPARVNNHYGPLILATGLQALLNIGTRSIAGSTTGFNPTVEQQIADEIARSVNRTGNQIVQRELQRSPTLTQDYGFPVTMQFSEHISFQSAPTVVAK